MKLKVIRVKNFWFLIVILLGYILVIKRVTEKHRPIGRLIAYVAMAVASY